MPQIFAFTRNPSVKVGVDVVQTGLVSANNTLVLIGRMAATGSSATAGAPVPISNYGDYVAAQTEVDTLFGAGSELGKMVIAAIKGITYSDLETKAYAPIVCLPMASTDTDLATLLANNISLPMPYVATCFPASDATNTLALKTHLQTISGNDRGINGQFGSFGFVGCDEDTATASPYGTTAATQVLLFAWLRDTSGTKANATYQTASALAAVCASLSQPYLPLNGVRVGGLVAPAKASDFHTAGDAGSVALGLNAGLVPLTVSKDGSVCISRTVTSLQSVSGVVDSAYYDMQDWQVLYLYRTNAYNMANSSTYKRAKASDKNLLSLKSELIKIAKDFELLEMFQHVDQLADQFTVTRPLDNRHAGVYACPVNVIPGFHNKGIGIDGTTAFDTFIL